MRIRPPYRPLRPVLFLLLLLGCSTEKDTLVHRTYHNTTARYNGFYYADLSIKRGLEKIRDDHEEDYEEILPVFNDGDENSASVAYPEMDRAIEKLSIVIDRHSMNIRGKQKCKWIDDSYVLLGRAYFYKRNFSKAEEMFTYVTKKFRREPIRPLALIWLARTHLETGKLDKAKNVLTLIEEDDILRKMEREDLKDFYNETWGQLLIQREEYEKAIPRLETAVDQKRWLLDRKEKTRLHFILGQLYHELERINEGNRNYAEVVRLNPPYEMAFYAKINQALAYQEGTENAARIKAQLMDMLKDDKNRDYFDRIYYALAELELKRGYRDQGIRFLEKSTRAEKVSDKELRTKAYLRLADLYFEDQEFTTAQSYYDTTYKRIDNGHPRYFDIEGKANSLNELVKNLETIEKEDSLLRMADMNPKEREKLVEDMIDERVRKAKERKRKMEVTERELREQNAFNSGSGGGSTFYFYNEKAKSSGYNNFKRLWGDRPLEDDWRRSSSSRAQRDDLFSDPEAADTLDSEEGIVTDPEYYMKNLPLDEKKQKESKKRIAQAMYNAAMIYREELDNEEKTIEMFRELVDRFELPSYTPPAYYQLYRIYRIKEERDNYFSMNKDQSARHFKEIILERYPESEYAKLIRDPDALKEEKEASKKTREHYESTLLAYEKGDFRRTLQRSDSALSNGLNDTYKAKYLLLKGLSLGRSDSLPAAKKILQKVVDEHSGTPQAERAQQLLDGLKEGRSKEPEVNIKESPFEKSPKADHYFCITMPDKAGDAAEVENMISDFNQKYFGKKDLEPSSTFLRNKDNLIIVKKFKDKDEGMDYYRTFLQRSPVIEAIDMKKARLFLISQENFGIMFREQKSEEYMAFFRALYLRGQ